MWKTNETCMNSAFHRFTQRREEAWKSAFECNWWKKN